jgi:hypothetical protein
VAKAKKDWLDRLLDLHRVLESGSGATEGERENAWRALDKLLKRHGKTWVDVPALLIAIEERERERQKQSTSPQPPGAPAAPAGDPLTGRDLFVGIRAILREFLSLADDEYVAITLWVMLTYVARRFMHSARLILRSAVRGCGKTTCLDVLGSLVAYPEKSDNLTVAAFFRLTGLGDGVTWGGDRADRRGRQSWSDDQPDLQGRAK